MAMRNIMTTGEGNVMECDRKISRLHVTRVYHRTRKEYRLFYNTVLGSLDSVKGR